MNEWHLAAVFGVLSIYWVMGLIERIRRPDPCAEMVRRFTENIEKISAGNQPRGPGPAPQPVLEPGQMANWVASPARGINGKPIDFEYVRRA